MNSAAAMLRNGVRPERWTARDTPYLIRCRHRRATREGLKGFFTFTAPVSDAAITTAGEAKSWPFPQYFEFAHSVHAPIVAFADALYTVDDGALVPIETTDPDDGTSAAIPAGRDWHFLETPSLWMGFNGSCVVWRHFADDEGARVSDAVTMLTGLAHGAGWGGNAGRVLTGGFDPEDFHARADWPGYWAGLYGDLGGVSVSGAPFPAASAFSVGLGPNAVRWSSILAPDALDLLEPGPLMADGRALELRSRNEAGASLMPWRGPVLGMAELGGNAVVYGSGGVCLLEPSGKRYRARPVAGLPTGVGVTPGTLTRTHWAGDQAHQFLVDGGFELWRLGADGAAGHLGYSEHLSGLSRDTLLLAYDAMNDELYAGDGARCFLLVRASSAEPALCEAPRMPSRIASFGRHALRAFDFPVSGSAGVEVETGTFTTGGAVETLGAVWLKGLHDSGSAGWRLKVKYRVRAWDDWTETDWLVPDSRGLVSLGLPVLEWRFVLTSSDPSKVSLEDLGYLMSDGEGSFVHKSAAPVPGAATE